MPEMTGSQRKETYRKVLQSSREVLGRGIAGLIGIDRQPYLHGRETYSSEI